MSNRMRTTAARARRKAAHDRADLQYARLSWKLITFFFFPFGFVIGELLLLWGATGPGTWYSIPAMAIGFPLGALCLGAGLFSWHFRDQIIRAGNPSLVGVILATIFYVAVALRLVRRKCE